MPHYKKRKKEVTPAKPAIVASITKKPILKLKTPKTPVPKTLPVRAREFLTVLKKTYFVIKTSQPLSLSVGKQLHGLYPQQSNRVINSALYLHTHHHQYLKNLTIQGSPRYNLDGIIEGEIDGIAAHQAYTMLQKIKPKKFKSHKPATRK